MSINPFAPRLAAVAKSLKSAPRRDGLDQVETVLAEAARPVRETAPEVTDRQLRFIADLFLTRDWTAECRPSYAARLRVLAEYPYLRSDLNRAQASALIDCLMALPTKYHPKISTLPQIPAGRYAYTGTEGHTVFVEVDRPTEGRWVGYTFVAQQLGGKLRATTRAFTAAALNAIVEQGVSVCERRYGMELGVCPRCHTPLTNAESRAFGIGPVCRTK